MRIRIIVFNIDVYNYERVGGELMLLKILWNMFLIAITDGLWLLWLIVKALLKYLS